MVVFVPSLLKGLLGFASLVVDAVGKRTAPDLIGTIDPIR
jgi:hypothetical protein